jgi:hypothetical protein
MAFEAASATQPRLNAAVKARDREWQFRQARAMVYLKRAAGLAMLDMARNLEVLRSTVGPGLGITETEVREGQRTIAANGFDASIAALARRLGLTDAQQEESRHSIVALDASLTAAGLPETLQSFQDAMYEYGPTSPCCLTWYRPGTDAAVWGHSTTGPGRRNCLPRQGSAFTIRFSAAQSRSRTICSRCAFLTTCGCCRCTSIARTSAGDRRGR